MTRTDSSSSVLAHLIYFGPALVPAVSQVLEILVSEVPVLDETVHGRAEDRLVLAEIHVAAADQALPFSEVTVPGAAEQALVLQRKSIELVLDRTPDSAVAPTAVWRGEEEELAREAAER